MVQPSKAWQRNKLASLLSWPSAGRCDSWKLAIAAAWLVKVSVTFTVVWAPAHHDGR